MNIKELPYYVKFIFTCFENEFCFSTTDIESIKSINYSVSNRSVESFRVGDEICFTELSCIFKIVGIRIGHLSDDTEDFKYGIDMSDCTNFVGNKKQELFKINIDLEVVS